jgi:hypothetical protein
MAVKGVFSNGHVTFKLTVNVSFGPRNKKKGFNEIRHTRFLNTILTFTAFCDVRPYAWWFVQQIY